MRFEAGYRTVGMAAEHMYMDVDRMKRGKLVYNSVAKKYKNGAQPTDANPSNIVFTLQLPSKTQVRTIFDLQPGDGGVAPVD